MLKIPYFYLYSFLALRILRGNLLDRAGRERRPVAWMYRWVIAACLGVGVMYLDIVLLWLGVPAYPEPDVIGGVVLAGVAFSVAFFVLVNQRVLQTGGQPRAIGDDQDRIANLANRIDAYLDEQQPYLDPNFLPAELSRSVSADEDSIATALRFRHQASFSEVVNARRLSAFISLVTALENRERSILELAFASGFSSKATFYRLFRTEMGTSPSAYRKTLE